MTANRIIHHIFNQPDIRHVDQAELERLVETYPYFAAARLLLAQKQYVQHPDLTAISLKRAQLYSSNPQHLHQLLTEVAAPIEAAPTPVVAEVHVPAPAVEIEELEDEVSAEDQQILDEIEAEDRANAALAAQEEDVAEIIIEEQDEPILEGEVEFADEIAEPLIEEEEEITAKDEPVVEEALGSEEEVTAEVEPAVEEVLDYEEELTAEAEPVAEEVLDSEEEVTAEVEPAVEEVLGSEEEVTAEVEPVAEEVLGSEEEITAEVEPVAEEVLGSEEEITAEVEPVAEEVLGSEEEVTAEVEHVAEEVLDSEEEITAEVEPVAEEVLGSEQEVTAEAETSPAAEQDEIIALDYEAIKETAAFEAEKASDAPDEIIAIDYEAMKEEEAFKAQITSDEPDEVVAIDYEAIKEQAAFEAERTSNAPDEVVAVDYEALKEEKPTYEPEIEEEDILVAAETTQSAGISLPPPTETVGKQEVITDDELEEGPIRIHPIDTPVEETVLTFQPLYTEDYFAYKKLKEPNTAEMMNDKAQAEMRSFTDWLRELKDNFVAGKTTKDWYHQQMHRLYEDDEPEVSERVEKMAMDSIMLNDDIVSETLAEIWVRQHQHAKAIVVYQKLSLLNPGKNAYFAEKIKELQLLTDNNK